ncbi:MAG TPA: tetratricopeptide repeat protein, partial [Chitinophagaceae bacterium]
MQDTAAIEMLKEKIDDLNYQAWNIRVQDSPKALSLCKEALDLARGINYIKGIAEGTRSLGFCYGRLSRNDEALNVLRESLTLFESLNDLDGQSNVIEYMGFISRNQGDLASSLNLLYKALSLSEQSGFLENLATNHYQLGVTYKHLGDYERALDHLYKSISLNREMNNLLYEAYSINVIGSIYFDDARYEQALEYYKQGLVVRQQSGDKWGEAGSLDNIGFTYLKLENYDEAIKYCSQSLEISTGTDDKKGQANALLHLAEIYKQKNDTVQAAKFSHDSLEIRKASGDKRGEAEIFLFLSDLHKREPEKSQLILAWLNDALKIAEEIKALDLLSKTRFHLYEYYKTGEDFKEALKNLDLYTQLEKEFHKNAIAQKVANLEISHKAETISQRNNELTQLNERIERANAELKIEGSLERVRAASMGMRHSDDLINVINVIQEQLLALGIHFHAANFVTDYSDKGYTMWLASPGESFPFKIYVSQVGQKFFDVVNAAVEKGSDFATYTLNFEEKNIYFKNLFENSLLSHISEEGKRRVFESGGMASSIVLLDKVRLNLMNLDLVPYTDEENKILKRFGYAFEQSYTRFLDLQKAEAQAKEAQIEAALERIRARAMAMHSSHELIFVANILREQMGLLGQPELETCVLSIVDENSGIISNWNAYRPPGFSGEEIVTSTSSFAIDSSELTREMIQHYKSGEKEFTLSAAGEKLHEFFGVLIKSDPQVINYMGNGVPEKVFYHFTSFAGGTLLTVSYQSPTDDVRSLQRRSAAVFDMAYRRFIDLQKAEAQAREAKIEAALERVRSRTIAMHKSGELLKIIDLVGVELNKLELPYTSTTIVTDYIPDKGFTLWLKTHGLQEPVKFFVPLFDLNFLHRLDKALQNGEEFLSYSMDEKETHSWYQHMFSNTILSHSPEELKQIRLKSLNYHISVAFLKNNVELTVGIVDGVPYTEEQNTIIKRFGKVFEQAYTRYLDLQKAEAQAREAQIEAALERVRAKVMAMNNSKDLDETSLVFGEQLRKLAIDWQFSYFWLIDEAKNENVFWITWPDYKTSFTSYTIAEAENYFNDCLIAWRGGVRIHDNFVPPNDVQAWLDTFQRIANDAGGEAKRVMVKETFPDGVFYYDAMMKYGSFGICISKPATGEEKKIQCRFAIEFERAYTRFLDLKQAEIQAREAQIEAALERVRSCSMGMQKSEELKEVIQIVFEQVVNLNINAEHAGFVVDYKPQGDWHFWIADKNEIPSKITHPYFESVWASQFNEAKEKGKDLFTTYLNFEEKNKFYQELLSYVPGIPEESKQFYLNCPALAATTVLQDNVSLYIENFSGIPYTDEENAIMLRFGKVFQQTYTRFLDLQKAEAQAREAQIETALEKIRSHTMGMRSSEDLANVATVMFDQMRILGGDLFSFGIVLCDKHEKMVEQWHSLPGTGMLAPFFVPVELDYIHQYRYDQWKNGVELFSIEIPEDYIAHHFELMLALPSVKAVWEGIATRGVPLPSIPTWEIDYGAAFRYGYLLVSSFKPFKEEKIFPRFAKVFEQAYTRFLDLQKAEAQAREAQIQLSLERVRAKAMAMYHSDELNDVLSVLFEQFDALGISPVFAHLSLFDLENNLTTLRITGKGGKKSMAQKTVAIDAMDEWKEELANWKLSKPSSVSRIYYPKEVVPQIW